MLGSLHDTLAPLHSRDIQRRDHGRDPEDGRLGPLTFVARPATPLALRRRAGLSRTVPRVARTANREHSSFREASRAFFSFFRLAFYVLEPRVRVLTRVASRTPPPPPSFLFAQASTRASRESRRRKTLAGVREALARRETRRRRENRERKYT